jgi:hypothetical protein
MNAKHTIKHLGWLGSTYPRQVAWLRVAIGIWLLALTVFLYNAGHGGGWAWLLSVIAVVHFGLAYRLFRIARTAPDQRIRFQ